MQRFAFDPIFGGYAGVVAAALVLIGLLAVGPARGKTTRGKRIALAALRAAVIALVLAAMLRPTMVYTETTPQSATLIVLIDASRSMTVPDEINGKTRWQALLEAVADAREALAGLDEEVEVKVYAFDAEPHAVDIEDGLVDLSQSPNGDQTAIGYVLEEVVRLEGGKRLLGVILLSDGAQQALAPRDLPPTRAVARTRHLGYRVYPIPFGGSRGLGQARDVAVEGPSVADTVFVNNVLEVGGEVRAAGYANQDVLVELLFETAPGQMEVVAKKTVRPEKDGPRVDFEYVPKTHGEFKLTLRAAEKPGELNTTNNRRSTFVNVLKGGLKVLYLEGRARPEEKWIRRALDAAEEIEVEYHRINVPMKQRPNDFASFFEPGKYDVYILGDLDVLAFAPGREGGPNLLTKLVEAVDAGAGLIMIGGFHSFGPGGYANSPLARVLPVRMDGNERQSFGEPPRPDTHISGWIQMEPTNFGINHFTLMLARNIASNRRLWSELPKLRGANRFDRDIGSRTAVVLATTEDGEPLLIRDNYGAGRVMAFAADTTWLWWMGGYDKAHKRFWRQIILWLARKDESLQGRVWVKLDRRRFGPGDLVSITAGAETPEGDTIPNATFQVEVVDGSGARTTVDMIGQGQEAQGTFRKTQQPGDYRIEVTATHEGEMLGTARARFVVYQRDLELDNAAADVNVLEDLAQRSGGELHAPEQLPDLIGSLGQRTEVLEVTKETTKSLWDTWLFFSVFVGLLAVEWFLRKKWGLV